MITTEPFITHYQTLYTHNMKRLSLNVFDNGVLSLTHLLFWTQAIILGFLQHTSEYGCFNLQVTGGEKVQPNIKLLPVIS